MSETARSSRPRFPGRSEVTSELSSDDWLSSGSFSNKSAIHVGMRYRSRLNQILAGLHSNRLLLLANG